MAAVSGRLIIRPDANGTIQNWDENNYDQIDDLVVRPTSPQVAGDGESLSTIGKEPDELCLWEVEDFVFLPEAVVSGDIQLWYYNTGNAGNPESGILNIGGNPLVGVSESSEREGTDTGWRSFKFDGYDGSGLTASPGTFFGLFTPTGMDEEDDNFYLHAAYLEINYHAVLDYCKCHCPVNPETFEPDPFPYDSGACCHFGSTYSEVCEPRCAESVEIVDIKHESNTPDKDKFDLFRYGDISYSGDVLIVGDPAYNRNLSRGHGVADYLPRYNSNTSISSPYDSNTGQWDVIGGDTVSNTIGNGVSTPVNTKYIRNQIDGGGDPEQLMFAFQVHDDVTPPTGPDSFSSAVGIKLKIVERCDSTHPESCGVRYSLHNKTVLGEDGPLLSDVIEKEGASDFSSTFTERTYEFTLAGERILDYDFDNMGLKIEHFESNGDDTTYEFSEAELEVTYRAGYGWDVPSGIVKVYKRSSMDDPFVQIGSEITSAPGDYSYLETQGDLTLGHPSTKAMGKFNSLNGSGDVFAIGIPEASGGSGIWRAYAWNESSTDWEQLGQDVSGYYDNEPSHVGYHLYGTHTKMSADGSGVISCGKSGPLPTPTGYVTVHDWDGSEWKRKGSVIDFGNDTVGSPPSRYPGLRLAINSSGSIIAIGSSATDSYKGAVKVYQYVDTDWVQRGSTIEGDTVSSHNLGVSIDMSYDGDVLGIGVANVAGGTPGHYRVYKWNDTDYVQVGSNIVTSTSSLDGEAIEYNTSNFYGKRVSINEDGSGLLGGSAEQVDGIGTTDAKGFITHFTWNGTSWNENMTITAKWPTPDVADRQGRYWMGQDTLVLSKVNQPGIQSNLIFDGWGRSIYPDAT